MLGVLDYCIIGLFFIMFLFIAYLRRNTENKLKEILSYSLLVLNSLLLVGYLSLFYLVENYEEYLIYFFVLSITLIFITIFLVIFLQSKKHYVYNNEKSNENQDD